MIVHPDALFWALSFRGLANSFASRYGGPLFLVGSALSMASPADYDVRVIVESEDYRRLFGEPGALSGDGEDVFTTQTWARLREELKQSRRCSRRMRCNVDFQIQVGYQAKYRDRPALRLDRARSDFFDAGRGEP